MRIQALALALLLVGLPSTALAQDDPFADDADPFDDGDDPFAEYERQLDETRKATESLDDGDETSEDEDSGASDEGDEPATEDEETNDTPGLGAGLLVGLAAVVALIRRRR